MRSRNLAIAGTVLTALSSGTSSHAVEGSYSSGSIHASCAPWDGAAVEIRLTTKPANCKPPTGPYVLMSVWRGLPLHAGQVVKLATGSDNGAASRCAKEHECEAARSGTIVFERFDEKKGAAGRYELSFKDGDVAKGTFDVPWCAGVALCG